MNLPNYDCNGYSMSNNEENANTLENFCNNNNSDSEGNKNIFYIDESGNFYRPNANPNKSTLHLPDDSDKTQEVYKREIVWRNILIFLYIHIGGLYGLYLLVFKVDVRTCFFGLLIGSLVAYGITAGAHRLWTHRAYKVKTPLAILLMICQTLAAQNCIYKWARDHRSHHKFADTDADPHNINRGFFFAHMGWLMLKKHPEVKKKGKTIDMSDLDKDPVVMFQKKYYFLIVPFISLIIPLLIPIYCWGETFRNSWYVIIMCRYAWSLNVTWSINSFAHTLGMKPYDKNQASCDNSYTAFMTVGEGWHNYHHIFPWDYKSAELGSYGLNWTVALIDFFAKIGWAYDLRTVSEDIIRRRIIRTGDGSHRWSSLETQRAQLVNLVNDPAYQQSEPPIWGWEDKDMDKDDKLSAHIIKKSE